MTRHQTEGLDVHHESVRRSRPPSARPSHRRQAVIGSIDSTVSNALRSSEPVPGLDAWRIPVLRERASARSIVPMRISAIVPAYRRGLPGPVSFSSCARSALEADSDLGAHRSERRGSCAHASPGPGVGEAHPVARDIAFCHGRGVPGTSMSSSCPSFLTRGCSCGALVRAVKPADLP